MIPKLVQSEAGFTYIAALVVVVMLGIMAGKAAKSWKTTMVQERETELIWRGTQYREALIRYYRAVPGPGQRQQTRSLTELKDLLEDPHMTGKVRYLRKLYLDPITGKEFEPIRDAARKIVGVKSTSEAEPLKKKNFPDEYVDFEDKKKYNEWEFVYNRNPQVNRGSITGLKTSTNPMSPSYNPERYWPEPSAPAGGRP